MPLDEQLDPLVHGPSPADAAVLQETIERLLAPFSGRRREIIQLILEGCSATEIAEQKSARLATDQLPATSGRGTDPAGGLLPTSDVPTGKRNASSGFAFLSLLLVMQGVPDQNDERASGSG